MNHFHFGPVIPFGCVNKNANTFYATEFDLKGTPFKQNLNIQLLFKFDM